MPRPLCSNRALILCPAISEGNLPNKAELSWKLLGQATVPSPAGAETSGNKSKSGLGSMIPQPTKASTSSEVGGRCPVFASRTARSPIASTRHASCSGVSPFPSSTATGAAITQPLKASSSSGDGGRCPVDTSLAARSPMASARHASDSGVSLLLSLTTTATGAGVPVGEGVGLGADVAVGEGVGLGTNVAVGEGVGFDSPPHATETTSNMAAIATINGDHCMTETGTSLSIWVSVAGAGRRSMQSH